MPFIVVYEEREPLHRFMNDFLDLKPKLELKFTPILLWVAFVIFHMANALCFLLSTGILYGQFLNGWLAYLLTKFSPCKAPRIASKTEVDSIKMNTKNDYNLVMTYRKKQVMSKIANVIYGDPLVGFHHAGLMLISFLTIFAIIRWYNEANLISYVTISFGSVVSLIVKFVEFQVFSMLKQKADLLVKGLKERNRRNSIIGKTARSLWVITIDAGKPFYTVSRNTVIIYMERLTGFLIDALMTVKT